MHKVLFLVLIGVPLSAPSVFAQIQPQAAAKQQPKAAEQEEGEAERTPAMKPSTSNVPPNAPVITIEGLCDAPEPGNASVNSGCKTVITRSEFEELANTLQPGMPAQVRRQLANAYPRLLVLEKEAERRGVDKDPHYLESVKFAKLQLLNQELNRRMQEEASKISDKDLQDYYAKNSNNFEQAALQRIYIPRTKQLEPPKEGASATDQTAAERAGEAVMSKVAADLHTRAAAGEDFDKLEKDAYEEAGIKSNPPATTIPKIRRVNLPRSHADVFNLNPGEVSQLISDPSGYYIYKVQSKAVPTFDEVKPEIHASLQSQRMREEVQKLQDPVTTQLNEEYFSAPPAPLPPNTKPATPANEHKAQPQE